MLADTRVPRLSVQAYLRWVGDEREDVKCASLLASEEGPEEGKRSHSSKGICDPADGN